MTRLDQTVSLPVSAQFLATQDAHNLVVNVNDRQVANANAPVQAINSEDRMGRTEQEQPQSVRTIFRRSAACRKEKTQDAGRDWTCRDNDAPSYTTYGHGFITGRISMKTAK